MKIVLALGGPPETVSRIKDALELRGHRVASMGHAASADTNGAELSSADLIVADVEIASSTNLVDKLATTAPGIEFVLVGPRTGFTHPDVIDHLARPLDVDRLLSITDDLADVLDGERMREPVDLIAYETVFAGDSPQIRDVLRRVRLLARSDAPVWIVGDDGSGRSIIARAIHDRSARRKQPFVAINSGAYTDDELCRRLCGDDGAIEAARMGSLFIDRFAALGPITHRALVNYVESKHGDGTSPRFIVGIQRDNALGGPQQVDSTELLYRLKVLEIEIPPLKERARDLEQIVGRMLARLAQDGKEPRIATDTLRLLEHYSFPGNLLELAHALTHAYVLARGETMQPQHLPISIRKATSDGEHTRQLQGELEALDVVAKRFERDYLLRVLRSVGGNRGRAAEVLGLSRKGLWGKLKSHGISDDDIESDEVS